MAIDIIARGMIESSKNDISQLFDITKGGEIVNNEFSYTLNNAVDYPLLGLNLYGKSTQDGTPTPDNPVEIVSVGDSGTVEITTCGKNLFLWNDYTGAPFTAWGHTSINKSNAAINYTAKEDAASSGTYIAHNDFIKYFTTLLNVKSFTLSCEMRADIDNVTVAFGMQRSAMSTCNVNVDWKKYICVSSYTDDSACQPVWSMRNLVQTATLYIRNIQIEIGDTATDYEPYKATTASITSVLPLCGIPVDSGGNYTDSNGQQWVCDELIYNADGTGKIVKRIGSYTISSSSDVHLIENIGVYRRFAIWNIPHKNMSMSAPCTAYKYQSGFEFNSGDIDSYANCFVLVNSTARFVSNATTVDEFIAANIGVKFTYPLAEPTEIELTASEISALRQLQTFDGVTNIYNDGGADMDVSYCTNKMLSKYVMPITTGLQAQIDELKAAVISLGGNV